MRSVVADAPNGAITEENGADAAIFVPSSAVTTAVKIGRFPRTEPTTTSSCLSPSGGTDAIAQPATTLETRQERSKQLALAAARTAEDNRGQEIAVLDMRSMTTEFDYFVLVTGNSRRQLHAISEEIDRVLEKELGDRRMGIEGYNESRWILLDYGTVVVHLFDTETRSYYALEDLWGQAARVALPWQGQ